MEADPELQGNPEGLSALQGADVGLYLQRLSDLDRDIMVANLAAMFAEIMVDVSALAANLIPPDESPEDSRTKEVDDTIEVEVPEDDSEDEQLEEPERDPDTDRRTSRWSRTRMMRCS